jgi:DUF4097 and DUF4098 domain-containing protein YvlB
MNRFLGLGSSMLLVFSSLQIWTLASAETRKEPARTFPLQDGGYLSLANISGDVTIEGWKKNEVSIVAVKKGRPKDLDRISVGVEVDKYEGKDWIHVSTDYNSVFSINSGSVDYTIKVPSSTLLEDIELVNGDLKVTGVTGYLSLGTVNGSITASGMTGNAWVETVNGNLDLSFDKINKGQSIDLESVNGAVVLRIPAKSNAQVDAETLNGNVSSEFGLAVEEGVWIGRSMEGLIGSGGARIAIETINGSIDIKKK